MRFGVFLYQLPFQVKSWFLHESYLTPCLAHTQILADLGQRGEQQWGRKHG